MKLKVAIAVAALVLSTAADAHPETHYRKTGSITWVCHYDGLSNWGFCGRTTLDQVKKIDALAEDTCEHGTPFENLGIVIPHSMTGEAESLNYQCKRGHMVREPYDLHFDPQGYSREQWKPVR